MGVLFLAELTIGNERFDLSFTPSYVDRDYNVYESYLGTHPTNTYWTDWNGWYDNATINTVEVYIGQYLVRVDSLEDCCNTPYSIYDETTAGTVYINIPKHPWLYKDISISVRKTISFLSGPKSPLIPSDDIFNNEHSPIRLEVPKFTIKLSDTIAGLTKYSTFDYNLFNDDGYFDDLESSNFFNSPSYIKKTWKENPTIEDFITIRYGMVESIKIDNKNMVISCADIFRTLEEPVCKVIKDVFPDATANQNENLPVIYGTVKVKTINIGGNNYVAGENITSVSQVLNGNNTPISFSFSNGIITASGAAYAVVSNSVNKIGQIITDLISIKTNIRYINSFWDVAETNIYIENSPTINIAFKDKTVRDAIKEILKSDMAFLIQKNDGRFTLRQWGHTYNAYTIDSKLITKHPVKSYSDAQKNYFSSCTIEYNFDFIDDVYRNTFLFRNNEEAAETLYNKRIQKNFQTNLINENDVSILANRLSNRFTTLHETIQVGIGYDTSSMNLLDSIQLDLIINGRQFSKVSNWIVIEIDPAQDVLTLEAIYPVIIDEMFTNFNNDNYNRIYDEMYSDTDNNIYETIIEGGEYNG